MSSSEFAHNVAAELDLAFAGLGKLEMEPFQQRQSIARPTTSLVSQPALRTSEASLHSMDNPSRNQESSPVSPVHPIPSMQGDFDESIEESLLDPLSSASVKDNGTAESRRRQLLELDETSDEHSSRWRQKAGAKYHPLRKLIAQVSYGIYLLHTRKALSETEVVGILQGHVDEIDEFVEDTIADFELAQKDIIERIEHLLLPLEHSRTFNRMLCDRSFRESIIEGNEIIERVIIRTTTAMKRAMIDVEHGIGATIHFGQYLNNLEEDWMMRTRDLMNIYDAMRGNAEGWLKQFRHLQQKSAELQKLMLRLGFVVDEVAKRCGIASRRKTPSGIVERRAGQHVVSTYEPVARTTIGSRASSITDKPLPIPPRRISTNMPSTSGRSPNLHSPQTAPPSRPSLSSIPSAQTLDCLRKPPQRLSTPPERPPITSSSSTPTVRFQQPATSRSPLSPADSEKCDRRDSQRDSGVTLASAIVNIGAPRPRSPSKLHPARAARTTGPSGNGDLTGLGIHGPLDSPQSALIDVPLHRTRQDSPIKLPQPARPHPVRAPGSDPIPYAVDGPAGLLKRPQSPLSKSSSRPVSRSFSVFPSLVDPRERKPRFSSSRSSVSRTKSTPRLSHDLSPTPKDELLTVELLSAASIAGTSPALPESEHPAKEVVQVDNQSNNTTRSTSLSDRTDASRDEQASSGSSSGSRTSLTLSEVPGLSATPLADSSSLPTSVSFTPQTPDDFLRLGGLRSHPVNPDLYKSHSSGPSLTALPALSNKMLSASTTRLPTFTPAMDGDGDFYQPDTKKRTMMHKKPSLAAMRTLFGRKPPPRDVRLGAGDLGGCVTFT